MEKSGVLIEEVESREGLEFPTQKSLMLTKASLGSRDVMVRWLAGRTEIGSVTDTL